MWQHFQKCHFSFKPSSHLVSVCVRSIPVEGVGWLSCQCPGKVLGSAWDSVWVVSLSSGTRLLAPVCCLKGWELGSSLMMRQKPHWGVKSRDATQTSNLTPSLRHRSLCVCVCVRVCLRVCLFSMGTTSLVCNLPLLLYIWAIRGLMV